MFLFHTNLSASGARRIIESCLRPGGAEDRGWLLIPVGYPADKVLVPKHALERKPLDQVMVVK